MHKKEFNKIKVLIILISLILIFSTSVSAEFFKSNLQDFVKGEKTLSLPLDSQQQRIEVTALDGTVLINSKNEKTELKASEKYYVSRGQLKFKKKPKASFWTVQLMAASTEEKALAYKNELAAEYEQQFKIIEEDGLYKVLIGNFKERKEAAAFVEVLKKSEYNGWPKQIAAAESVQTEVTAANSTSNQSQAVLNFYNSAGKKIAASSVLNLKGNYKIAAKKISGETKLSPISNSILISYQTKLEELTAHLLQHFFNSGAPTASLQAQAVIYRTALLYQIETQGSILENLNGISFAKLKPVFKKAAAATKNQVLTYQDKFYYQSDFSLKKIKKARTGIISLAQADYSYSEIIEYYYDRAKIKDLSNLLDSEIKFTARIKRGLNFKEIRQKTWSGPRIITVIDLDLTTKNLKLKPVLAGGIVPGRQDLGDMVKSKSALAGINGGYFHYSGRPLGLVYLDGILIGEPLYNRTALLIDAQNQLQFSQVSWQGELDIKGLGSLEVDGANRSPALTEAVIFNSYYGAKMPSLPENYYDIVVRSGTILGVENESGIRTPLPPDGYVVRVGRQKKNGLNLIPKLKNKKVELKNNFEPDFAEQDIVHALGGGPRLIEAGEIKINGETEKFQPDILRARAPRTALALTENDHLLMLTVDGRQQELSVGMTLKETAEILKKLGAVEAMNLDGGGSARMVIRGFTMSNPSEKRLISNGVIVDENEEE